MTPETFARMQQLFDTALELPPSDRDDFLRQHCSDPEEVEQLRELLRVEQNLALTDTSVQFGSLAQQITAAMPSLVHEGSRIGAYRIQGQIGVGGMGRVFRAERSNADFQQTVAIKLLRQELVNPSLLRRFSSERRLLAGLNHPGICRLIDAGALVDGTPYVVMELVEGVDLVTYAERAALSLEQRLQLFRQVLAAVSHAHQHLVVHRDIKASNILVDSSGQIRLLDFGIAKALDGGVDATATRDRYLSFSNASPEQLLGAPVTVACDVYALGVVLYELLCGRPPFDLDGLGGAALEELILRVPPPPMSRRISGSDEALAQRRGLAGLSMLQKRLCGDLECIVQKCLRKEVAARYTTVEQLDEDIAHFLARRPIRAADAQFGYRLGKFVARHRLPCLFGALAVLAVAGALVAIFARNAAAVRERDRAQQALTILRKAFLSADPARVAGEAVTVRAVLDAALPALEPSFEAQPELYASLAGSIAEVQLSLGLSTASAELFERAAAAAQRGNVDAQERFDLFVLRARALFAAGEFERARQSLQQAIASGRQPTPSWQVVQAGLLFNAGDKDGAIRLLRAAITAMADHEADDEWANLARLRLAELLGQRELRIEALEVLDATLVWQRRTLDSTHPRIGLTRLQRVIVLRQLGRHEEALSEATAVRDDAVRAYGARSPFAARAAMVLGNVQAGLKQASAAIVSYREAVAIFRASIGDTHPNTLRASYNLAEMLAQDPAARAEALALYAATLAAAEQRFGFESNAVVLFRLGYARCLLADAKGQVALEVLTTPGARAGFAIAATDNRRDYSELLRRTRVEAGCNAAPGVVPGLAEACARVEAMLAQAD
ncbi:MAG: protein kinase [Rhodanobacteraceae bacterium]|nr:protein kinase [Rhodanobacteraceae bacterium]